MKKIKSYYRRLRINALQAKTKKTLLYILKLGKKFNDSIQESGLYDSKSKQFSILNYNRLSQDINKLLSKVE